MPDAHTPTHRAPCDGVHDVTDTRGCSTNPTRVLELQHQGVLIPGQYTCLGVESSCEHMAAVMLHRGARLFQVQFFVGRVILLFHTSHCCLAEKA